MMRCNSQGNGYDYFTCGIACVWGRCIGEQVLMNELTPVTNCIKGEYKCVASDGKFTEYQCNQSGYWDVVQECGYGCFAGRCKSNPDSTTNCLKEGERYQDGKCCPGLVRATTPYGYFCGKPGGCTPGSTKCENNSFWKCNESGYYEKLKSCSFGCENGDCKFGCLPRSARCRDEKTLQVCADKGNAWVNRSCNYCHEGICYESRDRAQEVIDTGGITWDGENLPYCEGFGFLDGIGWNTCPDGFICGAQPVEDRNNLYYCERKTTTNTSVRVCSPYTSFCGEGGVLLTCSGDGNRWAGMQQCPQPRPEKGAQYNYSCRQVTPDRGECRPSTPEENRDVAIEMVAANALAVGSALALPAVIANLPAAMVIAQGANAAYSIGNAVYNCEYYSQLTPEQRETCLESGAYAAVNTASAIFGGLNYAGISNAFTVYGQTAVSGGSLALGVNNAVDVCQHSANPTECYLAIGSAVVDTVGFAGDVYSAGSFYQQQQRNYIQALAGNRTAFDALPSYLQQSVISQAYDEAYAYNVALNNYWNRAAFGDRIAFENLNAVDQQAVMPLIHREALYQNWIYNSNLPTLNVEVVAPRANPADWNMNIDSNDPGLIRAVTEVRDYLGGNSVTMDNLNMAVIDRNQAIVGYNRPGNPNHPWTNNNNQFNGPTNIGRYLNPDCPGNVCYQNAALLHIAAANNNIESQLALVYFDLPSGERSGHAVVLFGNDIYDPTWEKKWPFLEWVRNVLPQEGFTNLRFDSEVLVIPK